MCRLRAQQPWGGHEYSAVHPADATNGLAGVHDRHRTEESSELSSQPPPASSNSALTLPLLLLSSLLLLLLLLLVFTLHPSLSPSGAVSAGVHLPAERQSQWWAIDVPILSIASSPIPLQPSSPATDPSDPLLYPTEAAPTTDAPPSPSTPSPLDYPPLPSRISPHPAEPNGLVEVFMLAGQSNMVGFAQYTDCSPHPGHLNEWSHPAILQLGRYEWGGYSADGNDSMQLLQATDPLEHRLDLFDPVTACNRTAMVGPGMSFASTYHRLTGSNVTLVPCARETLAISEWRWSDIRDPSARSMLYVDCVVRVNWLLEQHPTWRFGGMLWLQGETDGSYPYPEDPNAPNYARYIHQSQLRTILAGFRADIVQGRDAVMVVAQLNRDWMHTTELGMAESVQWGLTNFPYAVNLTAVVYSVDEHGRWLSGRVHGGLRDPIHYSVAAARELGIRYAYGVLAARHNYLDAPLPGIIVQLFVPSHCYLPLDDSPPPPLPPLPSSPPPFQCVASWVPDPHAVSYHLRLSTSMGEAEVATQSNASSHRLSLPPKLRAVPALPTHLSVQVASVVASGKRGEWSAMGRVKLAHRPLAQRYTSAYPPPDQAPWPYLWLSASALADHLQVDEIIGPEWLDLSGAGHSFNSPQPPRLAKALDGSDRFGVRFEGSQWLTSPTAFPSDATAVTVVLALSFARPATQTAALMTAPTSVRLYTEEGYVGVEQFTAEGQSHRLSEPAVHMPDDHSPVILSYVLTDTDTSIFYNGSLIASHAAHLHLNASAARLYLASPLARGDHWRWKGDLYELLVYDTALTPSQHQRVVGFLNRRLHSPLPRLGAARG